MDTADRGAAASSTSMLGMNPLQFELDRLYGLGASVAEGAAPPAGHGERQRGSRALVLELRPPAGWSQLSALWSGAQVDLGLPPPAIAVSGGDGLQLWFSLAAPASTGAGALFLQGLRSRYLPDLGASQVHLIDDPAQFPAAPPFEASPDRWSAFIAPDLASVFADAPWLDVPPNAEGQAALLRPLEPIRQTAFEAALNQLGGTENGPAAPKPSGPPEMRALGPGGADAERFLRRVMDDETVPLALRIEAAKALLGLAPACTPGGPSRRQQPS